MKIGIIGFGYVGQAVYSAIKFKDNVYINDKYKTLKNNKSIKEIKENAIVFLFV